MATTGLGGTQLLRASHVKPWTDCDADAERLDFFNGLLLAAHLDAAFDAGFIMIAENGTVLPSNLLPPGDLSSLGIDRPMMVHGLRHAHEPSCRENELKRISRPPPPVTCARWPVQRLELDRLRSTGSQMTDPHAKFADG